MISRGVLVDVGLWQQLAVVAVVVVPVATVVPVPAATAATQMGAGTLVMEATVTLAHLVAYST
jgi:hypothetical protein